jgi:hypothetical protein
VREDLVGCKVAVTLSRLHFDLPSFQICHHDARLIDERRQVLLWFMIPLSVLCANLALPYHDYQDRYMGFSHSA